MSKTVKLDQSAFNRGVDEVLLLKPLRRALFALIKRQGTAVLRSATHTERESKADAPLQSGIIDLPNVEIHKPSGQLKD